MFLSKNLDECVMYSINMSNMFPLTPYSDQLNNLKVFQNNAFRIDKSIKIW